MNPQRAYDCSPIWMQNAAISTLGMLARIQRYGRAYNARLRRLQENEALSAPEWVEMQTRYLRALLATALRSVPYYRDLRLFDERDVGKVEIADLPKLLPTLTKTAVRDNPSRFHSDGYGRLATVTIHTSGTSGSPLDIRASRTAIGMNYAFFGRFLGWHGVSPLDRSITFAGRLIVPRRQVDPPFHRHNLGLNDVLLSSYRISDATKQEYFRVVEAVRPRYIDAYPSAIYSLARMLLDARVSLRHTPQVIVTSSETLLDHQRRTIETFFQCPVRDQYGSAELSVFASECEHGSLHINPDFGLVELIRDDGRPALPGEIGRIVATGFWNHAMPLIRYELGDSAILDDRHCSCGRSFPVIRELVGRTDDLVRTPSGRLIGRLDPAFKGMPGLLEAQVVQTDLNELTVNVVLADGMIAGLEEQIRANLLARLEPSMRITVRQVVSIPRTSAGKFKSVISLLHSKAV